MEKNQPKVITEGQFGAEANNLETHVVVSHERHTEIQKRFDKVDIRMDRMEENTERQFTKIERIISIRGVLKFFLL